MFSVRSARFCHASALAGRLAARDSPASSWSSGVAEGKLSHAQQRLVESQASVREIAIRSSASRNAAANALSTARGLPVQPEVRRHVTRDSQTPPHMTVLEGISVPATTPASGAKNSCAAKKMSVYNFAWPGARHPRPQARVVSKVRAHAQPEAAPNEN